MYTPNNPPTTESSAEILSYLHTEFLKISEALTTIQMGMFLDELHAAPAKPRDRMIVIADGTDWNPGSGAGVYVYRGGAWHFLG